MVRLRHIRAVVVVRAKQFQFHMVRLRRRTAGCVRPTCQISIPHGTIKTLDSIKKSVLILNTLSAAKIRNSSQKHVVI